ncbi:NADP-dependent 3-hydroxy acid dehydrogenase YdfG [Paucimonas lemoignei]|uniref:NADP-dependent 3-hydroxy acid dehydrogenase YdfG n=1 Tax=Paucimonas lemoignei TaxID=29443 RepID=A0A4R3I192_PAULE|nr:SDR family oxidoreductase [Paucimonas lemoignei]TCS39497.1 NADP-dependent 3-hydroxy acid dehydrogenase YdfG [Paucimonas lemoignei]
MKEFAGRVAVITGAAGGFGQEFARKAASLGMKVAIADIETSELDSLQKELRSQGADVLAQTCNVSEAADVQALADAVMARYGTVHLLFNNAGVGCGGLIWEHSEADWDWLLGVNLKGVIHGVRIFTPLMLQAAAQDAGYEGHIVNTASVAGLLNASNMGAYNVTKHAVVSLSETLYHDLRLVDAPIGASVLCPHYVPTKINKSERSRPQALRNSAQPTASQVAARLLTDKAVRSGRLSAAEVAQITFDAVRDSRFYIHTHPEMLDAVQTRMEDILQQRNPHDALEVEPRAKELLQARLKANK